MSKDAQSYGAYAFHPQFGGEGVPGTITLTQFTFRFEYEGGVVETPFNELGVQAGKRDDPQIYFRPGNDPDWQIVTANDKILSHRVFSGNTHLRNQVEAIAGRTAVQRAILTTLAFCAIFGLACVLISLCAGLLVRVAVDRIPPSMEKELGDKLYTAAKSDFVVVKDEQLVATLNRIFDQLRPGLPDTNMAIQFHIVEMKMPNAFSIPGHILVTRGLFDLLNSPDELAGVLAHEVGHINKRHVFRKIVASYGPGYVLRMAFRNSQGIAARIAENSQLVLGRSFDRSYEREADDEGWKYLVAAHINPRGMIVMLHAFKNFEHDYAVVHHSEALSTHPPTDVRISRLESHWEELKDKSGFIELTWQ